MSRRNLGFLVLCAAVLAVCVVGKPHLPTDERTIRNTETAVFAAGCFWHVQDTFDAVKGVTQTTAGYTGGHTANPTYQQVCSERTGHAEAVKVSYDPSRVTYAQLLDVFFASHDPTTADHQGPDYGRQYRSAIFYLDRQQKLLAEQKINQLNSARSNVVTELRQLGVFYPAEEYHQHYDRKNGVFSLSR